MSVIKLPRNKKVIIVTHHNADIDAIASSTALLFGFGQKNIRVKIGVANSVAKQARSILDYANIRVDINPNLEEYDVIFVLDVAVPEQLYPMKLPMDKEIIVIDHHENNKIKGVEEFISPRRKSTCELILKVLKDNNVKITKKIANLLLAGIISDTNHFKFADKVTFKLVAELLGYNADIGFVFDLVHNPPEFNERLAKLKSVRNMDIYRVKDYLIALLEVDEYEAAIARGVVALGADVSIVFTEKKHELRVSARANSHIVNTENLNLGSDIFSKIDQIVSGGGGGHDAAGSLNTPEKDKKEEIKKFILDKLCEKLGNLEKI